MPQDDAGRQEDDRGHRVLESGQLAYLQLPATDISRSASFYREVFGWEADDESGGFGAPGLIGQWTVDRPASTETGPLLWLHTDDMAAALERVQPLGGRIDTAPFPDGPVRMLAVVVDPAGNAIGLAEHRRTR